MSAKEAKMLDELRAKELKALTDSEYQTIRTQVETDGIRALRGSSAQIVFAALRKRDEAMKKRMEFDKHQGAGHDQASHGSWAGNGNNSGLGDAYASSARNKLENAFETVRDKSDFANIPNSKKALELLDKTFVALQEAQFETQPLPKLRAAQSASAFLQEMKTDFLDKMDSSSKSKFSGFISEIKGAFRDTESLQDKILSNFDDEGNSINKAKTLTQGDMVSWNSSGGTARGKVVRIVRDGKINVPDSSFEINGTEDDPAVLIQLYRDGKPTDTKVGHKMSTLKKNFDLAKHGNHDQKTHGKWAKDSEGEYVDTQGLHKPHLSKPDDSEGEFEDTDDDMEAMDMMDILRPPKITPSQRIPADYISPYSIKPRQRNRG